MVAAIWRRLRGQAETVVDSVGMNGDRWRRVEEIYNAALQRDKQERPAFVAAACGADVELQREVESLLAYGLYAINGGTPALTSIRNTLS